MILLLHSLRELVLSKNCLQHVFNWSCIHCIRRIPLMPFSLNDGHQSCSLQLRMKALACKAQPSPNCWFLSFRQLQAKNGWTGMSILSILNNAAKAQSCGATKGWKSLPVSMASMASMVSVSLKAPVVSLKKETPVSPMAVEASAASGLRPCRGEVVR